MHEPHPLHVHPFMFPLSRDTDSLKIHWFRDGAAVGQVLWLLAKEGLEREDEIINRRETTWPQALLVDGAQWHVLLLGTRPPISDGERRKIIPRSWCEIENAILNRLLAYFCYLERSRVVLTRELAAQLDRPYLADIEFDHYGRAAKRYRDIFCEDARERCVVKIPSSSKATYAYLVRDQLWIGGPEVVSFFGMDGETTLAFGRLLRTRHPELLRERGLSIVKLKGMIPPKARSLAFIDGWTSTVVLEHGKTTVPPPQTRALACATPPLCGPDFAEFYAGRFGAGAKLTLAPTA